MPFFTLILLITPALQEGTTPAAPADSAHVETLRQRIHGMRMNLLLGGEKVRQAEGDAAQFYRGKIEVIEQRMDSIAAELAERRTGYQLALQRSLQASGEEARRTALREAADQRRAVAALEGEEGELGERTARISKLIGAVDARSRERERLAVKLESSSDYEGALALPLGGIGLAPEVTAAPASSPLEDETLIEDLLAIDPVGARRLLFDADPSGYWRRFPLRPPLATLRSVLKFPPADLPGQR